jgi:hypothetical protein
MTEDRYDGPVVFSEGVHYPVGEDGHPVLDQPLRVTPDGGWRPAKKNEPLHNEVHHLQELALDPGGED